MKLLKHGTGLKKSSKGGRLKIGLIGRFSYPCSIERYYLRALKQFDHKVVVDVESILNGSQKVDLTIVVKWFNYPEMLPRPRVLIFTDLTERFKEYYERIEKYYDYVFLVHNEKLIDNKRIFYLPVGYDPLDHFPIKRKKDIDCLFIGTCHESRNWMKDIDIITRYGNEWGDTNAVYGAQKRELHARAKIILNMHYPGDTTNMRLYESLAMGCFQLTDQAGLFKNGRDLVIYNGREDMRDKIKYYLKKPNKMRDIAEQGYNTITNGKYKYVDRISDLLNKINEVV